jgi:hypothetical protein
MGKKVKVVYGRSWSWGWGIFLLLVAALVLANQFGGFIELGFWSLAVAALAVAFFVQSLVKLNIASLPIPLAALYWIFQTPLELPEISFRPLVLVTLLTTVGLQVLLPKKLFRRKKMKAHDYDRYKEKYRRRYGNIGIVEEILEDIEDVVEEISEDIEGVVEDIDDVIEDVDDTGTSRNTHDGGNIKSGGSDNNPRISVKFGGVSRYLHADSLETVELDCSFGSLEVYFDHVQLSPDGAEAFLDCKFGAIEMYVPSHWRVIDNMSSSLGGVSIKGRRDTQNENAPTITLSGNVSFGGVEIHRI